MCRSTSGSAAGPNQDMRRTMKHIHVGIGCTLVAGLISGCGDSTPTQTSFTSATNKITASAGTTLSGFYGNFVIGVPQVTVTDKQGKALAGATVTFTAIGGGRLTGATALTDGLGNASPTSWRLGSSGTQAITASVTD